MSSITVDIRSNLGPHRAQWDQLVREFIPGCPQFLSALLEAGAHRYPTPTSLVLVSRNGTLLGGLPVSIERGKRAWRLRRPLETLWPTYWDLLSLPGEEQVVVATLRGWFRTLRNVDFSFRGVRESSLLEQTVMPYVVERQERTSHVIPLPDDIETFLSSRSTKHRGNVLRHRRCLHQLGLHHTLIGEGDAPHVLETLSGFLRDQHGPKSYHHRSSESLFDMTIAGIKEQTVSLHALMNEHRIASVVVCLESPNGKLIFLQPGRDTVSQELGGAGNALILDVIDYAIDRGFDHIDMLGGNFPYKSAWASDSRVVIDLRGIFGWRAVGLRRMRGFQERFSNQNVRSKS